MPALVKTRTLVVVLSRDGKELDRATAADGKCAVKAALPTLARRDTLATVRTYGR